MPYRRLPNTDSSRLKALKTALQRGENIPPKEKPFSQSSLLNISSVLPKFEMYIKHQKEAYLSQTERSPEYSYLYKKARNYVSHFIQVLNLAIIRGDLKKEARDFFGLDINVKRLPTFKSEQELIKWGDVILEGEQSRIGDGGNPMTNPTIGVVRVHYEKFVVAYRSQKTLQDNYVRATKQVAEYRPEVDRVILQLWNEIEASYEPNEEVLRRNICREFGLVYFFRRNEKIPVKENVSSDYREKRIVNKDIVKNIVADDVLVKEDTPNLKVDNGLSDTKVVMESKDVTSQEINTREDKEIKSEDSSTDQEQDDDESTNFQYSLF